LAYELPKFGPLLLGVRELMPKVLHLPAEQAKVSLNLLAALA
jgi:hypothetical protein